MEVYVLSKFCHNQRKSYGFIGTYVRTSQVKQFDWRFVAILRIEVKIFYLQTPQTIYANSLAIWLKSTDYFEKFIFKTFNICIKSFLLQERTGNNLRNHLNHVLDRKSVV